MLGDRANPYDAVAGLASTLETADEGSEQLAAVARAVASAFGVGFVSVEVDRSGGERLVATYGERPAADPHPAHHLPRRARWADWCCPRAGLRSRLSRRDEQLLGDLVRQAATAARTSRLAEELQESRERLVTAREEERRRIRRDLHDGLGPALSGVVFQLESARLLVDKDPEAAKDKIGETSAPRAGRGGRRTPAGARPAAARARRPRPGRGAPQQAEQLSAGGPATTIEASDLGTLPAAVEVAAFRIAGEALANVARHAARHDLRRAPAGRATSSWSSRSPTTASASPPTPQAGVGLVSPAGAGRRARRPQRGHLSGRAAAPSSAPGCP